MRRDSEAGQTAQRRKPGERGSPTVVGGLLLWLMLLVGAAEADAQPFVVQGSFGPTVLDTSHNLSYGFDPGHSLAAGFGFSPTPRLTFLVEVDRTHRASQLQTDARGDVFGFRGGTLLLATAALKASLFGPDRIGPYVLAGFSAGVSKLRTTARFPNRVRNDVRALTFGGGIQVPLRDRLSLFVDGRMTFGEEDNELLGVLPIRAGLSWRF